MNEPTRTPLQLSVHNEPLRLKEPFRIHGYTFEAMPATVVTLDDGTHRGRGEAAGVYYLDDRPDGMLATIESLRATIEAGLDRKQLRQLLPPGGARNALDCALWELEAQRAGRPVWELAGVDGLEPLLTTFTVGADTPARMAERAVAYAQARAIKLKLTGELALDLERVRQVRAARPDVWLAVDANQGYGRAELPALMAGLQQAEVALLEQPCRRGHEADLDGIERIIPVAADESCLSLDEMDDALAARFDVVNIKLDKCGGLTEGLLMARRARERGLKVMVGNMAGSSWGMAPACVIGQLCDVVDLDGPLFLCADRVPGVRYEDGRIHCPAPVWGAPAARAA